MNWVNIKCYFSLITRVTTNTFHVNASRRLVLQPRGNPVQPRNFVVPLKLLIAWPSPWEVNSYDTTTNWMTCHIEFIFFPSIIRFWCCLYQPESANENWTRRPWWINYLHEQIRLSSRSQITYNSIISVYPRLWMHRKSYLPFLAAWTSLQF